MQHKNFANEPRLRLPPILSNTPSLVETMIEGFEAETLEWRPSPERWSVTMVIAHLAESEINCFRPRLRRTATEQGPILEAYDQWAQFREQPLSSASEPLKTWKREREETLRFLGSLPANVESRRCTHRELGQLTFGELLNEFAFHDMGHMRQILEVCRSREYYPYMGGWRQYYQVNP